MSGDRSVWPGGLHRRRNHDIQQTNDQLHPKTDRAGRPVSLLLLTRGELLQRLLSGPESVPDTLRYRTVEEPFKSDFP